jgi:hypothetical protein
MNHTLTIEDVMYYYEAHRVQNEYEWAKFDHATYGPNDSDVTKKKFEQLQKIVECIEEKPHPCVRDLRRNEHFQVGDAVYVNRGMKLGVVTGINSLYWVNVSGVDHRTRDIEPQERLIQGTLFKGPELLPLYKMMQTVTVDVDHFTDEHIKRVKQIVLSCCFLLPDIVEYVLLDYLGWHK